MLTSSLLQKYCHLPREANKESMLALTVPSNIRLEVLALQEKCHAATGEEKRHQPSARCLFLQRGMFPLSE